MKKLYSTAIVLMISLIFGTFDSYCQDKKTIELIEEVESRLLDSIELISKQVHEGNDALFKAENLYDKANKHIGLTEKVDSWFTNFLAFIAVTIFGLLAIIGWSFFSFRKYLKKFRNECIREISEEAKIQQALIKSTVKNEEDKQNFFKETKILVISKIEDRENEPYLELKSKFERTELTTSTDDFSIDITNCISCDVVVLDNQYPDGFNWNFNDEELKSKFLELTRKLNKSKIPMIYYGNNKYDGNIGDNDVWNSFRNTFSNRRDSLVSAIQRAKEMN